MFRSMESDEMAVVLFFLTGGKNLIRRNIGIMTTHVVSTPDSGFRDNKRSDCHFQGCHVSHVYYLSFDLYTEEVTFVFFFITLYQFDGKIQNIGGKDILCFCQIFSVLAARIRLTDTIKLSR